MNSEKIRESDFPALYQAADEASLTAQRCYVNLFRSNLTLTVLGACLAAVQIEDFQGKSILRILAAMVLFAAFLASLALRFLRYEKTWYGARAVAESVKTMSWRYMMRAEPFELDSGKGESEKLFLERLSILLAERKSLAVDFVSNTGDQLSEKMITVRRASTQERANFYLKERVQDQRGWYNKKSVFNRIRERKYFIFALLCQAVAFFWALYLIMSPHSLNMVGVFAALTSSFFSWMQIRKFQELAQAYAVTAQDLGLVEAKASNVSSEKALSDFVSDAENAISREHTMWIARRDHR